MTQSDMRLSAIYERIALAVQYSSLSVSEVAMQLPNLSVLHRKDLLTLCRCQAPPIKGSIIEKAMKSFANTSPILVPHHLGYSKHTSFRDWLGFHMDSFTSPAKAGFLSMMLRVAPGWIEEEVEELLAETVSKELSAAVSTYPTTSLDYRCFFSRKPRDRNLALAHNISPDPENAADIHVRFCRARRALEGRTFFPDYSRKTVGLEVSEEFWRYYDLNPCFELEETTQRNGKVSLLDIEKMWDRMAIRIGGAVELRRAWKYNDLKPRAYFARGGSVHWVSRHIQAIVNIIIDEFPEVGRRDRFSEFEDRFLDDDTSVFVYDYTSFTSKLQELNSFIGELGEFLRGTTVFLYDIRDGLVEYDLGDYFQEYLEEANLIGRFMMSRDIAPEDFNVEFRNTCGMLGVPGNIFLATLLHGLHLRMISGIGRSKCVGDDAKAKVPASHTARSVTVTLQNLGEVHPDKTVWFLPKPNIPLSRYQYIKRPYFRAEEGMMISGHLLTFPSIILMADDPDPYHTIPSVSDVPNTLKRSLLRFMDQLYVISMDLSEEDRIFCWWYAVEYLALLKEYTESYGDKFRRVLREIRAISLPPPRDFGLVEPRNWIIEQIPDTEKFDFPMPGYSSGEIAGYTGETFVREGSKLLAYLEDLGYVSSSLEYMWMSKLELGSRFYETYFGLYRYAKTYTVVRDLPVHAVSLLNPV